MFIFYNREAGEYKFKCFSTGIGGTGIDLLVHLFKINYTEAARKLLRDYGEYRRRKPGGHLYRKMHYFAKWQVRDWKARHWNTRDAAFYRQFNISSAIHDRFCVKPLDHYELYQSPEDGEARTMVIRGDQIYGYFTQAGQLYKIYQPFRTDAKFIRVQAHIQGLEQLEGHPFLLIGSSMKDIETLYSFKLKIDLIAPHSENELLNAETITGFKERYQNIITLLDIDAAGVKAMREYSERYGFRPVYLPLEKDVSDSNKVFGPHITRRIAVQLIDKALNRL